MRVNTLLSYSGASLLAGLVRAQSVLLLTPHVTDSLPACLEEAYYGSYGRPLTSVFIPSPECLQNAESLDSFESGHLAPFEFNPETRRVVWLQEDEVDEAVKADRGLAVFSDSVMAWVEGISADSSGEMNVWVEKGSQDVIRPAGEAVPVPMLHHVSANSAIFSLPHFTSLEALDLPPFISMYTLSRLPYNPPASTARLTTLLSKPIIFDPSIASLLSSISPSRLISNVRHLSGEDGLGLLSRHSFSKGALEAADWIQAHMEAAGADCTQKVFLQGFAPNVICKFAPTTDSTDRVILSAHYDSRGSFGSTRAPGADDDGSGTTHLLSIAHAIHSRSVLFHRPVELVAFAGEEQGLLGSKAYAKELKAKNVSVALMIQADMLGYHDPREPMQLGLPDVIGSPLAAQLVANLSKVYAPELTVGYTKACCSDHQSFHEQGYAATQVFERAGPIVDPMYHNSGDLANRTGYDVEQIRSIAKVTFAALLETAGYEIAEEP